MTTFGNACLAVDFAHTRSVFHRDLKPSNLMLGAFGEMYVLDWGIATPAASEDPALEVTDANAVCGTPGYMAPEQLKGEAPDGRNDVYSLGAILYEILTLEPMHPGRTVGERCTRTLAGNIERPTVRSPDREIPPELEAICMKATVLAKADRYASAREIYDALERYLEGDRDLGMRRATSREHAERAASLAQRAFEAGSESTTARSDALRSVGRALTLDPDNPDALRTLVRLLTQPPRETPDEALADVRAMERGLDRARARGGTVGIVAAAILMPIMCAFNGIRSLPLFLLSTALSLGAGVASVLRMRRVRRDGYAPTYVVVTICAGIAAWGLCFSPQFLTPSAAIPLAVGYTLSMDRGRRLMPMLLVACAEILPFVLEQLGVVPASQIQDGPLLCAVPRMALFPPPGSVVPMIANLAFLIGGCYFAVRFRDVLTDLQGRAAVSAWQLRQLLPQEARPAMRPPASSTAAANADEMAVP